MIREHNLTQREMHLEHRLSSCAAALCLGSLGFAQTDADGDEMDFCE